MGILLRCTSYLIFYCLLTVKVTAQPASVPAVLLEDVSSLDTLLSSIGDARIVLLGEASHGSSEYYQWRSAITKRLIREKAFNIIAVEGDWSDCYGLNEFIKGPLQDSQAALLPLRQFTRWPAWIWNNRETLELVRWLNADNAARRTENKTGFYGLDVYGMYESIASLKHEIPVSDTALYRAAHSAYQCLVQHAPTEMGYAVAVKQGARGCATEAGRLWEVMKSRYRENPTEEQFSQQQDALVVQDGERFFRNIYDGASAWNLRENHIFSTIRRLLEFHGPGSKIIIWAHNTHVGDARASTMSTRKKVSLGQLLRETYGESKVFITGFGTYAGTVLCGKHWDDTTRLVSLPPARPGSWEDLLHKQYRSNRIVLCRSLRNDKRLNGYFHTRAIGAVYDPAQDAYSSYTASIMARRYDAFIFLDTTKALEELKR